MLPSKSALRGQLLPACAIVAGMLLVLNACVGEPRPTMLLQNNHDPAPTLAGIWYTPEVPQVTLAGPEQPEEAGEVYLAQKPIEQRWLRLIAKALDGEHPVHCTLIWSTIDPDTREREWWETSLVQISEAKPEDIIGMGDGYRIVRRKIDASAVRGDLLPACDSTRVEWWARQYAGTSNGDLSGSQMSADRDWFGEPQGYGGPLYEAATCNTYIAWLILKTGGGEHPMPVGAVGWDVRPRFPGPRN